MRPAASSRPRFLSKIFTLEYLFQLLAMLVATACTYFNLITIEILAIFSLALGLGMHLSSLAKDEEITVAGACFRACLIILFDIFFIVFLFNN